MKSQKEYIALLQEYFRTKASKYGVVRMAFFGSVARSEQHEGSDVDIAYEGKPNIFLRIRMKRELEELFGCNVDIIRLGNTAINPDFKKSILKDLLKIPSASK